MKTLVTFFLLFFYMSAQAQHSISSKTQHMNTKLLLCTNAEDLACIKSSLKNGADISTRNSWQDTPLHLASMSGNLTIVQFLIENHTDTKNIIAQNRQGMTSLHLAALRGHLKVVQALIKKYPNIEHIMIKDNTENTVFHHAALRGQLEVLQFLNEKYPDPKYIMARGNIGQTPLHRAALLGHSEVVQFLIKQYPFVEHIMAKDDEENTALHLSVHHDSSTPGAIQAIMKSLPSPEDILVKNRYQQTPFELSLKNTNQGARILFGNSPPKIKKQLVKICQDNDFSRIKLCEQLIASLENQDLPEAGGYQ